MNIVAWPPYSIKSFFKTNATIAIVFLLFFILFKAMLWLVPSSVHDRLSLMINAIRASFKQRFFHISPAKIKFFVSLLVGLIIITSLHISHDLRPIRELEDWGGDFFIKSKENTMPDKPIIPYAFLDMNDDTFSAWHEPFFTPRDKLLTLLKTAVKGKAKVVIVDIDLRREGDKYYGSLMDYLGTYDQQCNERKKAAKQAACTPIILMRSFHLDNTSKQFPSIKPAPAVLENIVLNSPNIHWASPLYDLSKDQLIRYWNLWQPVCHQSGGQQTIDVLPSAQLLTMVLATSDNPTRSYAKLMLKLQGLAPSSCNKSAVKDDRTRKVQPIMINGVKINFGQAYLSKRVFYAIPWQSSTAHTQAGEYVLQLIPAHILTDAQGKKSLEKINNRIVIIGASHQESGDIHMTPLGKMPGSMVIINAIHSLQQFGDVTAPYAFVVLVIQLLLIIAISLIYACWSMDSSWLSFIALAMMVLMLPLSMILIGYGIWLDFALPLLAVQIYQIILEYYENGPWKKDVFDAAS